MKLSVIVLIAAALTLTGCGALDRGSSWLTGKPAEVCHDGTVYLVFTTGATVKIKNGTYVTC
jgi:hypothetical protein